MTETVSETVQPFYWDQYRDNTLDRYLLQRELSFIRRFVDGTTKSERLLEVCCGSGRVSLPLHDDAGHSVVGVDKDVGALAAFRRRSKTFPLVEGDGQRLPFADGSFDYVVAVQCFHYFEHRRFLQECYRILSDSGLLMFQSLNRCSYKGRLKGLVGRSDGIGPSVALSSLEVMNLASKCNFDIQAASGYNWAPLTRSSNSAVVSAVALLEKTFKLDRLYSISPWILVSARKKNLDGFSTAGDQRWA